MWPNGKSETRDGLKCKRIMIHKNNHKQQQTQQYTYWDNDFIFNNIGDILWWMEDLCFGVELIFSSNRIM